MLATLAFPTAASTPHPACSAPFTRTKTAIPQIVARDFGSIGYGYGYAFAQDNLCVMAADYVSVEGQRSRWFGPTASYQMRGNGVTVSNLDSDIFWTTVRQMHTVDKLLAVRTGPGAVSASLRDGV